MQNRIIDIQRVQISPAPTVITLAEAKAQAIVTYTEDDSFFTALIVMGIKTIENYCNISIYPYTITMTADLYNSWELPYGPVTAINGVQTRSGTQGSGPASYRTADNWQTDGEQFLTFIPAGATGFNPGSPFRGYFQWGPFASRYGQDPGNRYKIIYTTGYAILPDDLKQAILAQIAFLYEKRGEEEISVCDLSRVLAQPYQRQLWL